MWRDLGLIVLGGAAVGWIYLLIKIGDWMLDCFYRRSVDVQRRGD